MKEGRKNNYYNNPFDDKPSTLTNKISYWLFQIMFQASPGVNVLVGAMVRVPNS
ncbi:MAG: hypothetical protein ABJF11_02895 [Reichenbachiella sp.]|uniref:hypothetical protein n=1 Tax=Reichenbachiella sp. TaxID=2184521 RepID=UPI003264B98D